MAKEIWTIKKILDWTTQYFKKQGIENSRLNAELLLGHVLKKSRLDLYLNFDQPLSSAYLTLFKKLLKKRSHHIPLSYLTGEQDFMSLRFKVGPEVYIPRPETELLVEQALKAIEDLELREQSASLDTFIMVDLGTGCGNIAISLARKLEKSKIYAIDISSEALKVARENAKWHGLERRIEFLRGDLFSPLEDLNLEEKVDLVISNPPYVATEQIKDLPPEVRKEPLVALEGGKDGLNFYGRIIREAPRFLSKRGFLTLEVGYNQAEKIKGLVSAQKSLGFPELILDYEGNQRVIITRKRMD